MPDLSTSNSANCWIRSCSSAHFDCLRRRREDGLEGTTGRDDAGDDGDGDNDSDDDDDEDNEGGAA